jgi:hypothetical protein
LDKCGIVLLIVGFSLVTSCKKNTSAGTDQTAKVNTIITSTTDANGNQHPASIGFSGSAVAQCLTAVGGPGYPASCFINGQIVNVGSSVGANSTVSLTCNGAAPLKCQAKVTQ